jgi:predicted signal transduction protein with EAL and GGDEF domain
MLHFGRAIKLLEAVRDRGVRIAIDDFGTGYSSMSMMKQFPIDTIKVDRSFVRDFAENAEDRAIATAIISMGKALGLTVVAEGVETSDQDAFLRQHACDELQSYLLSKPVPRATSHQVDVRSFLLRRFSRRILITGSICGDRRRQRYPARPERNQLPRYGRECVNKQVRLPSGLWHCIPTVDRLAGRTFS